MLTVKGREERTHKELLGMSISNQWLKSCQAVSPGLGPRADHHHAPRENANQPSLWVIIHRAYIAHLLCDSARRTTQSGSRPRL